MNTCGYSSYLSDYLDRQLNIKQESMLTEHLPLCANCKKELEEINQVKQICNDLSSEELPAGLHQRIILQIQRQEKLAYKKHWIQRMVVPLAAVVLLFLIGRSMPEITGNNGRDKHNNLQPENIIMATPEADSADGTIAEEATIDDLEAGKDEVLSDKMTEDSFDNSAEAASSHTEEVSFVNQTLHLSKPVKLGGIGVALLLICICFLVNVFKMKR